MCCDSLSEAGRGLFNVYVKSAPLKFRETYEAISQERDRQKDLLDEELFQRLSQLFINSHWGCR